MTDQVWIAVLGAASTLVVTAGTVAVAYFSLREKLSRIEGHTNGLLQAANDRAGTATQALADVATTAVTAAVQAPNGPPSS